jgi:hypothetical protein
LFAGGGRRQWIANGCGVWALVEPAVSGVVANICEGRLILCFANIQFFEINEVSKDEWVAQNVIFVHHPHLRRS